MKVTIRNLKMEGRLFWLKWQVFFLISIPVFVHRSLASGHGVVKQQYCPYFGNRAPKPQSNLRNCTWYKDNSCCYDEEIAFAFGQLSSIPNAEAKCVTQLNYLYCYICAPDQNTFFFQSTLTVCEEFCDKLYQACGDARLKGEKMKEKYGSGKEFCERRRFKVAKMASKGCFNYDPSSDNVNSAGERTSWCGCLTFFGGLFALIIKYVLF